MKRNEHHSGQFVGKESTVRESQFYQRHIEPNRHSIFTLANIQNSTPNSHNLQTGLGKSIIGDNRTQNTRGDTISLKNQLETFPMTGVSRISHQFQELKVEDALHYLDLVKQRYADKPQIYMEFLQIMKKFKYKEIDTQCVINSIKRLFQGNSELIAAFNSFIPQDFKSAVFESAQTNALKKFSEHAQNLVGTELEHSVTSYPSSQSTFAFNQSMSRMYSHNKLPQQNLYVSRSQSTGLPSRTQASSYDNMPSQYALDYVNKMRARFGKDSENYQDFITLLHFCQTNQSVMNQCTQESRDFHLHIYREMSRILQFDTDLLDDFMNFLPDFIFAPQSQISETDNQNTLKRKASCTTPEEPQSKVAPPCIKVESTEVLATTLSPVIKVEPSKSIELPPQKITTIEDIREFVESFLAPREKNKNLMKESILEFIIKNVPPQFQEHLLRVITLHATDTISTFNLKIIIKTIFTNKPLLNEEFCNLLFGFDAPVQSSQKYTKRSEVLNDVLLSSQMIDFCESNRIGHSYFRFKKEYVQPVCSNRKYVENEVLNDFYISSQPVSGEDIPLSGSKKATAHINLVKTEQDRYDFDMMLHSNLDAIEYLENIQMGIDLKKRLPKLDLTYIQSSPFQQINCYKALDKIYGNHISLVIEGLKSACTETLKIVINALKIKQMALYNCSFSVNKNLSHEMSKYALKALDYQGSTFKSGEGKNIRMKCSLRDLDYDNNYDEEPPVINILFKNPDMYREAHHFISYTVKKMNSINRHEKNKLMLFLNTFHRWIYDIRSDDDSTNMPKNTEYTIPYFDKCQIYVNSSICIYIRLCNMLFDRMHQVHELFLNREDTSFYREIAHYRSNRETHIYSNSPSDWREVYSMFETMIYNIIDGSIDSDLYEEWCLCTFGLNGYNLYTIEKMLLTIVRHLNTIPGKECLNKYIDNIPTFISNHPYDFTTRKIQNYPEFVNLWSTMFENESCYMVEVSKQLRPNTIFMTLNQVDVYKVSNDSPEYEAITDKIITENKGKLIYEYLLFRKLFNSKFILIRNVQKGIENRKMQNAFTKFSEEYSELVFDPKIIYISYKLPFSIQNDTVDQITFRRDNYDLYYYRPYSKKSREYIKSDAYKDKIEKFKSKINDLYNKFKSEDLEIDQSFSNLNNNELNKVDNKHIEDITPESDIN